MTAAPRRSPGSRVERDAASQLLVDVAMERPRLGTESATTLLSRTTPDVLLALADYHGVSGLAYERLRELPAAPEPLVAELRQRYASGVERHMRVMWELARVGSALDRAGFRWAVIKGPVLVETLYASLPGRRAYFDLDLLVDPAAFADALAVLDSLGARLLDRNWRVLRRDMRGELHLLLSGGTPLDLHWHLINMYRGRMRIDTSEVVGRVRRVDLGGVAIPTLDAADGIVHLALHAALAGGDRLLWLKDIERAAAVWRPDWETVVERARRWNVGAPVGLLLSRSTEVLDADIPSWVPARLGARGAIRIARWVDGISPWEYGMGRVAAPTRILARSVGHGLIGGIAWIAWRSLRNLDPQQELRASTFTAQGNERDREAFVDAVLAEGRPAEH